MGLVAQATPCGGGGGGAGGGVEMFTFGSLFTGIGGFDLGFERAGMVPAWQVEIDAKCQEVMGYYWPDVEKFGDVRDVGKRNLTPIDLLCGGFPCQDLSVAGKRKGLAGERSGLWFQFARVIGELRPKWVVIENVPGLLSSGDKRDMGILLGQLAKFGYLGCYRVLDAQFYGVAQRRRRVFIVGCLGDASALQVLFESESSPWDSPPSRKAGQGTAKAIGIQPANTGANGRGWLGFDISPEYVAIAQRRVRQAKTPLFVL